MRAFVIAFSAAIVMGLAVPIQAHHSYAGTYDGNKPMTIRGKITKLGWLNPHAHFSVDVVNQKGETVTWEVESASATNLLRAGIRKEDFIGTEVIVKGFLAKDGTPTVNASSFTLVELKKEYTSDEATPGAR